jgi:FAD/FMN-containing dehydrogenase
MSITEPRVPAAGPARLQRLRAQLAGEVHVPGDPGYDDARAAWNLAFDARPALVVEPQAVEDVVAAVAFAEEADLGVAVQATGHGVAGCSDEELLISTRRLRTFEIEPTTRSARIGAGMTWGPVLAEAQRHGLAPLVGSAPHVGAVGYTLGGGMGWLARAHGLAADTVRAAELVTADGRWRRVDADHDPDLLWALRGGGAGSLGVVTALEVELVEVPQVYAGNLLYPPELAEEVFARFRDWVADVPDELTSAVAVVNYPPFEEVPAPVRGRSFAVVRGCWCGPVEEGAALFDQWRSWRSPELDLVRPMPFAEMAEISQDPVDPVPALVGTESLVELTPAASRTLIEHTLPAGGPPALMFSEVRHGGGALRAQGRGAGHARLRDVGFVTHVVGVPDPVEPVRLPAHLASLRTALAPHRAEHAYLNFLDGEERQRRTAEAFTAEERRQLRQVKERVDPRDRFRFGLSL